LLYFLILLIIGVFGGAIAGLLGVGGGLIFTPVLIFVFTDSFDNVLPWIIGTSLLCTFAASLSSVRKHLAMKNFFWKEALMVGMCSLLGTIAGKAIVSSHWYSQTEFIVVFSMLLLYTAYRFFRPAPSVIPGTSKQTNPSGEKPFLFYHALLIGTLGGLVATLAGVGGGIVMVPIMMILLKVPYNKTISISSAAIVIISFFGWFQFAIDTPVEAAVTGYSWGYVDLGTAFPLIIGALFGANAGVWISGRIPIRRAQILFAIINLLVAARLIYGLLS